MSEEFEDEAISINSIYGDGALSKVSSEPIVYALTFPSQPAISVRLEFAPEYPDVPPSVLGTQSIGDEVAKGEGTYLVELVREVLSDVYTPSAPCIFDLIEEVGSRLQQLGMDKGAKDEEQEIAQMDGQPYTSSTEEHSVPNDEQPMDVLRQDPPWTLSEVITEKKSIFIARAAPVTSITEAKQCLAHLLATDKKVAKATHNITAWRIQGDNGVQYQDCDDDGETAAGGRVLHLLELMGVWDVMLVVTRWYGGIQLGPDRFRIINQTARDALVKAGFATDGGKEANKKKGKR